MAELTLHGIHKSYDGRKEVVKGISFEVAAGQVLTVLGPSGCGKSTLLRIIAGLERPDAGEVRMGGRVVTGLEPKDRDVAMVFQSYALYPHMKVFDNIAVGLRLRKTPSEKIRARVEATARRLGIEALLERRPRALSGGERQRVALARALVREPEVFLLDEPLSNLDAQLREHARTELKEIFRQARATVVYVTHDQIEALTLSDRVAVMNAGRFEQIGSPREIYARPETTFVAGFVGSPRMNLIDGTSAASLLDARGAAVVGIRPEDIVVEEGGPLRAEVLMEEPLGPIKLLTLRCGEVQLRATIPADRLPGRETGLRIRAQRAHRFDSGGRRLD
jgi:ABC-type sugar transport system ATPase subunit